MSWNIEWKNWLSKGFWSVMDQGLFAGSNFLLNILLARWLTPKEYGTFVLAYTIFWLLGIFHLSFLTEPMLVFGSGKYKNHLKSYLRFLYSSHWWFALALGFLFLIVGYLLHMFGSPLLASAFWSLALAGPFLLLQQLMRRLCYVREIPKLAAISGGVYFVCICLGAFFLVENERLALPTIFGLMGLASFVSCVLLAYALRTIIPSDTGKPVKKDSLEQHWHYGKWAVGNGLMAAIPDDLFRILLPIWGGLEATGAFRALTNLLVIPTQILNALGSVLIPFFVKIRERPDYSLVLLKLGGLFVTLATGYWLCLGLFGQSILDLLYQGKYTEYAPLLWIIGLVPIFQSMTSIMSVGILARENPRLIFWSRLWATLIVSLPGVGLMAAFGIWGAGMGMVAGFAASVVVLIVLYQKDAAIRKKQADFTLRV